MDDPVQLYPGVSVHVVRGGGAAGGGAGGGGGGAGGGGRETDLVR